MYNGIYTLWMNSNTIFFNLILEDCPFVIEYDQLISGPLADFMTASGKIGGLVKDQVKLHFFHI